MDVKAIASVVSLSKELSSFASLGNVSIEICEVEDDTSHNGFGGFNQLDTSRSIASDGHLYARTPATLRWPVRSIIISSGTQD